MWIGSGQPYSAYAVHLTTLSPPAFIGDGALVWLLWKAGQTWLDEQRHLAIYSLLVWMFISKFSKNLGHYIRYPSDAALLPVSIFFGWFHGLIKLYAMVTLDVVSVSQHCNFLPNIFVQSETIALLPVLLSHGRESLKFVLHMSLLNHATLDLSSSCALLLLITLLDCLGQSSRSRHKFRPYEDHHRI